TQCHPKGDYDRILHALGAANNASTWLDRTNYYVLAGSDRYETALELETDRMRGALLSAGDLEDERRVVLNELDRNADDPGAALADRTVALSFLEHPYRRPVIGWRQDVESITRAYLQSYYDRYYQPNNAFLVAVGRFQSAEMIEAIERQFGSIPPGDPPKQLSVIEPPQRGERRFELRKAGQQELMVVAYHAPQRADRDALAMDVLAQILGHGRTSRLYKSLVDSQLAVHASAENQSMPMDPFLFMLDIELAHGVEMSRVEEAIDQEIARLTREPVSLQEMQRARKCARVGFIMRSDSVSALAFLIGEFEVSTGWKPLQSYLDRLEAVSAEDVMEVAQRYLVREARTVGHFRPVKD
ncbi:MAG: insulinase family protein, partial [Candidatus Eisenbacteria sp.]|nr:insulinase family protein [Candidatus Eisenbacteria bacterium]